jgi:transcriptional regulator with XRE-family HTH domain
MPVTGPNNRLRSLRRNRGLTLEALARRAGTTNQQISNLEGTVKANEYSAFQASIANGRVGDS